MPWLGDITVGRDLRGTCAGSCRKEYLAVRWGTWLWFILYSWNVAGGLGKDLMPTLREQGHTQISHSFYSTGMPHRKNIELGLPAEREQTQLWLYGLSHSVNQLVVQCRKPSISTICKNCFKLINSDTEQFISQNHFHSYIQDSLKKKTAS